MTGFESWDAFFDKGFEFRQKEPDFMFDEHRALAGISAMHAGTYKALLDMGTYGGNRDSGAADAARIIIDAQRRFKLHKDDKYYLGLSPVAQVHTSNNVACAVGGWARVPCPLVADDVAPGCSSDPLADAEDRVDVRLEMSPSVTAEDEFV